MRKNKRKLLRTLHIQQSRRENIMESQKQRKRRR